MPKKIEGFLTEKEKQNPIGRIVTEGLDTERTVERLKKVDFLTDDLRLTRRGKEYAEHKLAELDSVERIMLEKYILEHHNIRMPIDYEEN